MLRRVSKPVQARTAGAVTQARTNYTFWIFSHASRTPQLAPEERDKVAINQDEWPEIFKNYDPMDPYKNFPDWHPGLPAWQIMLLAWEVATIWVFWDLVFPKSI